MTTQFLVIDLETLDEKPPAGVIEIGWTSVDFNHAPTLQSAGVVFGNIEADSLFGIPEGQVMSPVNRSIHHIDPAPLEGLPVFDPQVWGSYALGDAQYLVAHNSAFEEQWLGGLGLPWICTYKCAIRAWPEAPKHTNQALKYFLDMEDSESLYPPHRALPDARVTAHTLWRLLCLHPVETLLQWSREPRMVTKFPFGKYKGTMLRDAPTNYLDWMAGPKCEAADPDLKHSCRAELDRRGE